MLTNVQLPVRLHSLSKVDVISSPHFVVRSSILRKRKDIAFSILEPFKEQHKPDFRVNNLHLPTPAFTSCDSKHQAVSFTTLLSWECVRRQLIRSSKQAKHHRS